MKTISEYRDELLEKQAITLESTIPYMVVPGVAGLAGGKIYSDMTAPAASKHEEFQTELLKDKLKDILKKHKERAKLNKYEEVLNGSQRSIRL